MSRFSLIVAMVFTFALTGSAFGQGSDECATAEVVTVAAGGTASAAVDNTLATNSTEPIDPMACSAGFGDMASDVWFTVTAPADGVMNFSTCPPGGGTATLDTDMAIYEGGPAACGAMPPQLACSGDNGCAGFGSTVTGLPVLAGTELLVRIGGWDAASVGTTTLEIAHFGTFPVENLLCTVDPMTVTAEVAFDTVTPLDDVAISVNGSVVLNTGVLATPGPQTFTVGVATGASAISVVATLGGFPSPEANCTTFIADPCPANDGIMSPLADTTPYVGNVACQAGGLHADNSYFRVYDLINGFGVSDEILINCVTSSINASNVAAGAAGQPIRVRIHTDINGGDPNLADLTMIYEEEFLVPDVANVSYNFIIGTGTIDPDVLGLPVTPAIPCLNTISPGATLVVEVFSPDGQAAGHGYFTASPAALGAPAMEIGSTYLFAPACGLTNPIPFQGIGFNQSVVVDLSYTITSAGACGGGGGVANLMCDQTPGATTVDVAWTDAGGAASWTVEVDGTLEGTLPAATTIFTTSALVAYMSSDITITAWSAAGGTGTVVNSSSCQVNVGPAHSWLQGALPVTTNSTTAFDITNAVVVTGPPLDPAVCEFNIGDDNVWNDLYFQFTAANTGDILISTCSGTTGDTKLAIYTGNSNDPADCVNCNDDADVGSSLNGGMAQPGSTNPACTNFAAELILSATMGTLYTVRLGTFNAAGLLSGGELVINDCIGATGLAATVDCTNGDVTLSWTNDPNATSLEILRDGASIASPMPGTTMFVDAALADGDYNYIVRTDCGSGPSDATVNASVLTYTGQTDLVFGMEGLQSVPAGGVGEIDSAPALRDALIANMRNAGMVRSSFADYPCVTDAAVENVWIALGTFGPFLGGPGYRMSTAEGDQLAALRSSGVNVYFESADQIGFDQNPSGFDLVDGIDDAIYSAPGALGPNDGDDSFTAGDGLDGGFGLDLSDLTDVVYAQDDSVNDDFTDQLVAASADAEGPDAGAIMMIDDMLVGTGMPPIAAYDVMVHYNTASGGKVVFSSVEMGGVGTVGDPTIRNEIVNRIVNNAFGVVGEVFVRGDANIDDLINIGDAIYLLGNLFPPSGNPPNVLFCLDAADVNGDGLINIGDAIFLLGNLFPPGGGMPNVIPAPNPNCGVDPTPDALDCASYPGCP